MITDRLSLPTQVRDRLELGEDGTSGISCIHQRTVRAEERFAIQPVELRTDGDTIGLVGYASSTEVPYEVAGGPPYGWIETIARGAFGKSLAENDDVRLLVNHEGLPLARTASGTLALSEDSMGLLSEVESLDLENPTVQEVRSVLTRQDADQMSFAFRVTRQEWNDDYTERRIIEVQLFDVSVVTYPANKATIVGLRTDAEEVETGLSLALARAQIAALDLS